MKEKVNMKFCHVPKLLLYIMLFCGLKKNKNIYGHLMKT